MALSCRQQAERIEETVLQPVDQWVEQQEQRCRDEPCHWWTLCLNKLFCWVVAFLVKVTLWVATVVVRWVYRTVCTLVTLVVGVIALITGNTDLIKQALDDLWSLAKDGFYAFTGTVIFVALRVVDLVQTALGLQPAKRRLTKSERAILWPIFRESLNYDAIELVVGPAGILTGSGRALTMAFTIYLPSYAERTLVHECVHTWQFQFGGFSYIGNSAFNQLDGALFDRDYNPYEWRSRMDGGASWYSLRSVEAQAMFIEDVYVSGVFDYKDPERMDDTGPGAFFHEDEAGMHRFSFGGVDYTSQADAAWHILRTG
ncbi:hypothetical protein J5X84_05895 [Streptosporangiaceae bacterium NEAU-GS5]|nr:hypothetical protein [Streptosporangiaceae bacterium NEAU-GS5]